MTHPTLPRRSLGSSEIGVVGLGCGGYWGLPLHPFAEAEHLVRRAIEIGVSFLDTGPSYSRGNAEERLGRVLASVPETVMVGTKVGSLWCRGRNERDLSPAALRTSADNSRRLLGRDTLDLVQLHCRSSSEVHDAEVTEVLADLRDRGVCKHIGVSGDLEAGRAALDRGLFDVIMLTYNLLDRRCRPLIERATAGGVSVIAKSPLAHAAYERNILRVRNPRGAWYLARLLKRYRRELLAGRRFAFIKDLGAGSATQVALRYVLSLDGVSCAVAGTTRVGHLEDLVAAAAAGPLDAPALAAIDDRPDAWASA